MDVNRFIKKIKIRFQDAAKLILQVSWVSTGSS